MTTKSGFEFGFDPKRLDNMELLELIDKLEKPEAGSDFRILTRLVDLMLGDGVKEKLYDHVRTEDGRVPVTAFAAEVTEIFQLLGADLKK